MKFIWPESVRAELRAVDRESAMRILLALIQLSMAVSKDARRGEVALAG
jgi:hypothetical protein